MNGLLCCGNKFNSYTELPGDARNFWDSPRMRLYRWELVILRVYLSTAERAGDTGIVTTTLFIIRKCDQFGSFHARYSFHQNTPSCSDVASGLRGPVVTELSQLIYRLSVAISLSAIEWNDVAKSTATIRSPFCGYNMAFCGVKGRRVIVFFSKHSVRWFMKMSVGSLCCQQSVFQRYHSEKHYFESFTHKLAAKAAGIEITSLSPCV